MLALSKLAPSNPAEGQQSSSFRWRYDHLSLWIQRRKTHLDASCTDGSPTLAKTLVLNWPVAHATQSAVVLGLSQR